MSNWGDPYQPTPPQRPSSPPPYAQPRPYAQTAPYGVAPDRAFHEAELDAMHRSADRQSLTIRWVAGAALLVFLFLRTAGAGLDGLVLGGSVLVLTLAAVFVGALVARRLTGRRHRTVAAARPGLEVVEVWGARGLHGALKAAGVAPTKVRRSAATSLSLVPSPQGVELWTSAGVLVAIPWSAVVAVDESRGSITNDGTRPALLLVTTIGQRLLFVPRTRTNGGRSAGVPALRALVGRLESLRVRALGR